MFVPVGELREERTLSPSCNLASYCCHNTSFVPCPDGMRRGLQSESPESASSFLRCGDSASKPGLRPGLTKSYKAAPGPKACSTLAEPRSSPHAGQPQRQPTHTSKQCQRNTAQGFALSNHKPTTTKSGNHPATGQVVGADTRASSSAAKKARSSDSESSNHIVENVPLPGRVSVTRHRCRPDIARKAGAAQDPSPPRKVFGQSRNPGSPKSLSPCRYRQVVQGGPALWSPISNC